jgi:hypothetical protein
MVQMAIEVIRNDDGVLTKARFTKFSGDERNMFIQEIVVKKSKTVGSLCSSILEKTKEKKITVDEWFNIEQISDEEWSATVYSKIADGIVINYDIFIYEDGRCWIDCYSWTDSHERTDIIVLHEDKDEIDVEFIEKGDDESDDEEEDDEESDDEEEDDEESDDEEEDGDDFNELVFQLCINVAREKNNLTKKQVDDWMFNNSNFITKLIKNKLLINKTRAEVAQAIMEMIKESNESDDDE